MNILNEIKNPDITKNILKKLNEEEIEPITIMEVCGSHTMSIMKSGLKGLLPSNIKLISGPGCPVCVTPQGFIDTAIELSKEENIIITTFGDLIRVPGTNSTLQKEKALGRDIRVVYSPLDSLKIAEENKEKEVVFLAVGFETTVPTIALAINNAKNKGIENFSILNSLKTMPSAMKTLILDSELKVDGFLCPGHVATIIGSDQFDKIAKEYNLPLVVAGFESTDIVASIYKIIEAKKEKNSCAFNMYSRLVRKEGNIKALDMINEVFKPCESSWRGLGTIENAGLKFCEEYRDFDILEKLNKEMIKVEPKKGCICGDILKGIREPKDCKLFGQACNPISPVGACMVSEEGTCSAYYKYNR